jgi:Carboxypeptidase regulatory-like domain
LFAQSAVVERVRILVRRRHHPFWPEGTARTLLTCALVTLLMIAGCRRTVAPLDTAPKPAQPEGTISGTVHAPERSGVIAGRVVDVVNVDTNERRRVSTNSAGGFSFRLRPGRYRIELTLRDGESLVKQPDVIHLSRTDVDAHAAHADFIIGSRISRPRGPAYRIDDGLGSPVA